MHTPGPWLHDDLYVYQDDKLGRAIAQIKQSEMMPRSDEEREANARLIAASPDLLETLKSDLLFFKRFLEKIVAIQTKDERGYVVNGFAAAQIPDWEMKQRIDDIEYAISKAEVR